MYYSKKILSVYFFLFTVLSISQEKQIIAYNLKDGLPQSQVYDILQDNYGYIWSGTQGGGIARFDGYEFKVWNEKNGLLSNYIHTLFYANDSLFIGTKYGLSIKVKKNFTNYESPQINKITQTKNGLILGTNRGCYRFNKDSKLEQIEIIRGIDKSIVNDIQLIDQWYWVATNYGLWKVKQDFSEKIKLSNFDFKSIIKYNDKILCASYVNGIFSFYKNDAFEIIDKTKRISSINILNNNELWVNTDNSGIRVLDAEKYALIQKINKKSGLSVLHIKKVIKDMQSNIWVATSGGLFKIYENSFIHFDKDTGLKGNSIYAINLKDSDIYISNSEEGLVKIDSLGLHPVTQDNNFLNVKVKTIANDQQNLFVGTDGKGILVMHNSVRDSIATTLDINNKTVRDSISYNYQFTDTLNKSNGFSFNWIKKIHIHNNKVWVASYSSGIGSFSYNTKEKKPENIKVFTKKDGIKDIYINDITTDSKGRLWYASKNGHIGLIENNKVTDFGKVLKQKTSIRTLLFHKEQLYIATSGKGIWWSNLSLPLQFTQLSGKKELYSNNIYQLIFDSDNQLWAGSEGGVDKITLDLNNNIVELHHFGRNDGFLGIETCLNSVLKDNDNSLWFGTINGLTKYIPSTTKFKQRKPQIFFEQVDVMNKSLDSVSLKRFNTERILKLKPDQNLLGFYFKTVDINHPKELQYRWKLDDYKWSNWNKDTKVNIASEYGKHRFQAQSRNLNWIHSTIISFQFERDLPFFKKPQFIWSASALLGLLIISIIYLYFRRIRKNNKLEKERLQLENNLLSLEQKALRLQMNPHFIFNVLNGIKAMSINDTDTMHDTINKFARLLRATLINSRKDQISLSEEVSTLKNYIEVEQLMSEKKFSYKIELKTKIHEDEIIIPPMLIQPFVENAIRHGIMAVKREGKLTIIFETKEEFLHCTIIDNGIGFKQSQKNKTKSNHQSMALAVTKERIEHLSGTNTLIIEEIIDENAKLAGTKIQFKIPLITEY